MWWRSLAWVLVGPILFVAGSQSFDLGGLLAIVLCPAIWLGHTALQALAQAVVGMLVGLRIVRVEIGSGLRIHRFHARRTEVVWRMYPWAGAVWVGRGDTASGTRQSILTLTRPRLRLWLCVVAGPLTTIGLMIGLFQGEDVHRWWRGTGPVQIAFLVLMSQLVIDLFPLSILYGQKARRLLALPFASDAMLEELDVTPELLRFEDLREAGQLDEAEQVLHRMRQIAPHARSTRDAAALLSMARGDYHAAYDQGLALRVSIGSQPDEVLVAAACDNNLAYFAFLTNDPTLKADADLRSKAAAAIAGIPAFMGTRGTVLHWLGRDREAAPFLIKAYRENPSASGRALNAAALALVGVALGNPEDAAKWRERMRRLDRKCILADRVDAAIDGNVAAAELAVDGQAGQSAQL